MNHIVARTAPQMQGDKRMTHHLQREKVCVRWGEPSVETQHCMVIPCDVYSSRVEDPPSEYDIMIPKKFFNAVLDTQIVARRENETFSRSLDKLVSEGGFKPLFQRNNLNEFMKRLPDIEETEVDVRESNVCTKEWLVNEMLMFPSTWLLERQKNKFSRENNEKVLMGFVLSDEAYAPGKQELEKMQKHLGYDAIREYHYFFDGQPPMLIVEKSKRTLHQAMQDSMKFSKWNAQLCDGDTDTAEAEWKKVLRAVVAGCRYMEQVGGITYGNLCADNIVQTASGKWKITEFGSAKQRLDRENYVEYVLKFGLKLLQDMSVPEREAAIHVAERVVFINTFFSSSELLMGELFSDQEKGSMSEVEKELLSSRKYKRQIYREKLWAKLQPEETHNKKQRRTGF